MPISDALPITLEKANKMLDFYLDLDKNIEKKFVKNSSNPKPKAEVDELISSSQFNGFIFDKESIERLLKIEDTTHLTVILGAHEITSGTFKKGSFTVMAIGCFEDSTTKKLFPVKDANPGVEWPPKSKIIKIEENKKRGGIEIDEILPDNIDNKYIISSYES